MRISHDEYFMEIAKVVAKRSACLHRQVGCVLVDKDNHILSTGYNGPPVGVTHCTACARQESGRDLYTCDAVHAEMNALLQCSDVGKIRTAYITITPCQICTRLLMNTSCNLIVYGGIYTNDSFEAFRKMWHADHYRLSYAI